MIGIYFLKQGATIVYVGQSINIESRLKQHRADKDFNSFEAIECSEENLDSLEVHYILRHNPKLNKLKYEIKVDNSEKKRYKKKKIEPIVNEIVSVEESAILVGHHSGAMIAVPTLEMAYYLETNRSEHDAMMWLENCKMWDSNQYNEVISKSRECKVILNLRAEKDEDMAKAQNEWESEDE